jgi:hypothetical protein
MPATPLTTPKELDYKHKETYVWLIERGMQIKAPH